MLNDMARQTGGEPLQGLILVLPYQLAAQGRHEQSKTDQQNQQGHGETGGE